MLPWPAGSEEHGLGTYPSAMATDSSRYFAVAAYAVASSAGTVGSKGPIAAAGAGAVAREMAATAAVASVLAVLRGRWDMR